MLSAWCGRSCQTWPAAAGSSSPPAGWPLSSTSSSGRSGPDLRSRSRGLLAHYEFRNRIAIFVPLGALTQQLDVSEVKVHVYFGPRGVVDNRESDVLLQGLRGPKSNSSWIWIFIRGIAGSAVPINDQLILDCLKSVNINPTPTALRLTGHSRGCDSLRATMLGGGIKQRSIIVLVLVVLYDQIA